jgi:hypothetical protein
MNLFDKFLEVFKVFEKESVEYILIGGFAIILHGFPRLTQDIDILLKMSDSNIKKLKDALFKIFGDQDVYQITFDDLKEYAVVRYGSPDGFHLDLLTRIGNITTYKDIKYELLQVEDIAIRTATPESLYRLKKDSIRPEDQRDILFLKELIKSKNT